tara:strand:+ start:619 stop:804 length:186 start_codon:yes stop_codon:yes gene_type:complete
MRKKEELFDIVRGMEYTDAVAAVSSAINAQTSTIAAKGDYSREAVEAAEKLLASWIRVQRG